MNSYELRRIIGREEFSYQSLMVALKAYKAPLQKVNELLKAKEIIRVKKGLYVFQPDLDRCYKPALVANLIYGPSYVSFETALSYWGLIPERVETIQSVTCKRNKKFSTPLGLFTYRYLNLEKYKLGVVLDIDQRGEPTLMASPEKAIIDMITLSLKPQKQYKFSQFISDFRIDEKELLKKSNLHSLRRIVKKYTHPLCSDFLSHLELKKGG